MYFSISPCVVLIFLCMNEKTQFVRTLDPDEKYRYSVNLDEKSKLHVQWDVDYIKNTVMFNVSAVLGDASSFGIGFSDRGDLENSDFVVYWRDSRLQSHFKDCYTDRSPILRIDKSQDYLLGEHGVADDRVHLEFKRNIDTCDDKDYHFDNGTTHIVYFVLDAAVNTVDGVDVSKWRNGLQRVQILKPEIDKPVFPRDTWAFEIKAQNIEVPDSDTTYWWYRTKMPRLPSPHHIIQFEGVIQKGNEHLVHHMEVFHCEVGPSMGVRAYNGPGFSEGKPEELEACRNVIGAWAMGAGPFTLPNEAGTLIGGPSTSRYVLLEIHYNNPNRLKGLRDSSGIRFYVTSNLRPHNSGIMELGLEYTNKMAIPPQQKGFPLTGYCIPKCTQTALRKPIYVFGSQLHTHLTGEKVFTKHVRHGVELPQLNRDNHYSPHFQEIRRLPAPVKVIPGDALITTCKYNTMKKQNATIGGFSIQDEMCVNYIHYYPKTDLEVCKSSINDRALDRYFRATNNLRLGNTAPQKGDRENYQSIKWYKKVSNFLAYYYETSPISMQCNKSDGTRFPGRWEGVTPTRITVPLQRPEPFCLQRRHYAER